MADVIQLRRDISANWTSSNPMLHQGEEGLETDTGKRKTGDGVTAWNSLGYQPSNQDLYQNQNVPSYSGFDISGSSTYKTSINANSGESHKYAFTIYISTHAGAGNATLSQLWFLRTGYDGNNIASLKLATIDPFSIGFTDPSFSVSTDGFVQIVNNYTYRITVRVV